MLDDAQSTPPADDLPRPPRSRRAARRPAGPPTPVTAPPARVQAPQPVAEEPVAEEALVAEEPVVEVPAPKATRRRTTRKKAVEEPVQAEPMAEVAAEVPVEETVAEPTEETVETPSKPARRRRTARAAAVPEPEVVAEVAAEIPVEVPAAEPVAGAIEPASDIEARPETDDEKPRRPRRRIASPFAPPSVLSPVETEAALAELAQAIAGAPAENAAPLTEDAEADDDETTAEDTEAADESEHTENESAEESEGRRRRRRRGGRRRRRSGDSDAERTPEGADEHAGEAAEADKESSDDEEGEDGDGTRRRRRRRRRRGEDAGTDEDDTDAEVIVRVREPRRAKTSDEVTGIDGSTRLEAKRQRRRESRAAGRRRTPILSEAEFLSRRESVERVMAIRQSQDFTEIAVLEDNVLVEHYVDRKSSTSLIGNIYLGRVQNVLPSMEAAFIDIGRGRNAVLYAGEVDWDSYLTSGQPRKMEAVFTSGQSVLVQVTKDPVGAKGARLTSHISIPGRYIVYSPSGELSGISRKLPDTERQRLKGLLDHLIPGESSVIVRTAAEGVDEAELTRDVTRLTAQWEAIQKKVKQGSAPALLYSEPDATVRIVRDLFTEDFSKLVVSGNGSAEDAYETINAYVEHVAPHLAGRLERWDPEKGDVFADHRVDEQIAKALERKVFLPSGGSLIIDRTEAMTVIDVNTGKFTGNGGNLEATVTANNLEAAEEIVRQLRLRDIGGIIVIDFIDMVLPSNRELLLRRLVECLGRDRTRHQVSEVTSLGLVQLTRKKIGTGLAEAFTVQCETCKGRGYHTHERPVDTQAPADGGDRSERRAANRRGAAKPKATRSRTKKSEAAAPVEAAPASQE